MTTHIRVLLRRTRGASALPARRSGLWSADGVGRIREGLVHRRHEASERPQADAGEHLGLLADAALSNENDAWPGVENRQKQQ